MSHWLRLDVDQCPAATFSMVAMKIIMFPQEGSVPVLYYFLNVIFLYAFWAAVRPIADVVSGKDYFRITDKYGTNHKVYRKESPLRFYFSLVALALLAAFVSRIMLSMAMLDIFTILSGSK